MSLFVGIFLASASRPALSISRLTIPAGATGVVAQLRGSLKPPLAFSRISGADITVATDGAVTFTAGLAADATRNLLARVEGGDNSAAERLFTFTGAAIPVGPTPEPPVVELLPFLTGDKFEGGTIFINPAIYAEAPPPREWRIRNHPTLDAPANILLDWSTALSGVVPAVTDGEFLYVDERGDDGVNPPVISTSDTGFGPMEAEPSALIEADLLSVDPLGEFVVWDGTPPGDLSGFKVTVTRQGFNAAGSATTFADEIRPTVRIRQSWPNQASLDTARVALNRSVFDGDTVAGATNNSTLASPVPIFGWTIIDREVIGNSHRPRAAAWHISGVACVKFTYTDTAAATVTVTVTGRTARASGTGLAYIEYDGGLVDLTSLAAGLITLDAEAFPILGSATSVYDTRNFNANVRQQGTMYYRKHVAMAAAPVVAYVTDTGDNATGVCSTNPAVAEANPFLTTTGASAALVTANNSTYGVNAVDGCKIVLKAPYTWATMGFTRTQLIAGLVVTGVPGGSGRFPVSLAAQMISRAGSKDAAVPNQSIIWRGLDITQTVTGTTLGSTGGACKHILDNCTISTAASTSGNFNGTSGGTFSVLHECQILVPPVASAYFFGSQPVVSWLGVSSVGTNGSTGYSVLGANIQACRFENVAIGGSTTSHQFHVAQTRITKYLRSNRVASPEAENFAVGVAVVNFEAEECTGVENNWFGFAADGTTYSTDHVLLWHVALAGYNGRGNMAYNDVVGTNNRHKNWSIIGNVVEARYPIKSDTFTTNTATAPALGNYTGNWGIMYGVNCRGNFIADYPVTVGNWEYFGENSYFATNLATRADPGFTDNRAARRDGPAPTAGETSFTLGVSSPALARVNATPVPFDIGGLDRPSVAANPGSRL